MVLNLNTILKKISMAAIGLVTVLSLASCADKPKDDPDAIYDAITSKLELKKSFEGKNFFKDGIEQATLERSTDGDTASFTTVSGEALTVRFYGIDTPESTGGVEKWGKAASKFTEKILSSAKSIVLEASEVPAVTDSNASRYLGYVWYKSDDEAKYKNLNLQLVENGYTQNKIKPSDEYVNYFKEAEEFAKNKPLHIFDDDAEDTYFSTKAVEVDLKELTSNIENYFDKKENNGTKVRFTAYFKSVVISSTGTYTYTVAEIIDGVEYNFTVYGGYANKMTNFICIGTRYTMTGTVQYYNFNYQISGLTYVPMKKGGDFLTVVKDNYYLQFTDSIQYKDYYYHSLFSSITVTEASVSNNVLTFTGKATDKMTDTEKTLTFKCPVAAGFDVNEILNKTIITRGYQEDGYVQILEYSNITIK